jgi:ketopantoate reductase
MSHREGNVNIVVFGAGMQGTLYGVRLASAGHRVILVARGQRAAELRRRGAVIEHAQLIASFSRSSNLSASRVRAGFLTGKA